MVACLILKKLLGWSIEVVRGFATVRFTKYAFFLTNVAYRHGYLLIFSKYFSLVIENLLPRVACI